MDEEKTEYHTKSHRLYKSNDDRVVDGVCAGIAEYVGVDATVVRLLLVAFSILSIGAGIIFYILGMIIIPKRPLSLDAPAEGEATKQRSAGGATVTLVIGIIIVIIGITLLFDYYDFVPLSLMYTQFGRLALPIIFILIGGALLLGREKRVRKEEEGEREREGESFDSGVEKKRLTRSIKDKKLAGVCGGLAAYLEVDATIVRLAYVILAFASFGIALILYVVCAFIIPKEVN